MVKVREISEGFSDISSRKSKSMSSIVLDYTQE